jgi:peptide/nickel transport system permease protein
MALYILKRLVMTLIVVVLAMVFLGVLVHLVPGDPVKVILGPRASEALSQVVREEMELDKPVPVQVWHFLRDAAQGDLGNDFVSQLPVTEIIWNVLPHTLILAVASLGLAALVGLPLGVYAATHPNSWLDRVTALVSPACSSCSSSPSGSNGCPRSGRGPSPTRWTTSAT